MTLFRKQFVSGMILVVLVALVLPFAANAAPSTTSVFPVQVYTGTNVANDGWSWASGGDWTLVRSATTADVVHNADDGYAGHQNVSGQFWLGAFYIERVHLLFDTSSLPNNAVIESAKIVVNIMDGAFVASTTGMYVVSSGQVGPYATLETYGIVGNVEFGHALIPGVGDYQIDLNQSGIMDINRDTFTKYALRSWHDFNNVTPLGEIGLGLDGDALYVTSAEGNPSLAPRLVVTWHKGKNIKEKKDKKEENKRRSMDSKKQN